VGRRRNGAMDDLAGPLQALGLTILIEFCVLALVQRRELRRVLLAALLVNAFTEPVANAVYAAGIASWLAIEVAVVAVEMLLYGLLLQTAWRRALLLSQIANSASALIGVLLYGR
jgi:hypothetical protein